MTEISISGWLATSWQLIVTMFVAFPVGMITAGTLAGRSSNWGFAIGASLAVGLAMGVLWLGTTFARASIRNIPHARSDSDLRAIIRDTAQHLKGDVHPRVRELVRTLAKVGRRGETIRIGPAEMADPVEPVLVPFEPQLLEHVEAGATMEAPNAPNANRPGAHVGRNVTLKGGAGPVIAVGVGLILMIIGSILRRRIDVMLFLCCVSFVAILFMPVRLRASRGQWLLVPGGLAFRNTRRRRDWSLHVFDRARSVLCVYRSTKNGWGFAVADAGRCESAIATRSEVQAVLRAWLSPLPPPTVEQMSDWG